jgi:uncharacterized protein (TIGR02246 family)
VTRFFNARCLMACACILVAAPFALPLPDASAQQAAKPAVADSAAVAARIRELMVRYSDALEERDTLALDSLTATDAMLVRPNGDRQTKSEAMRLIASGPQKLTRHDVADVTVRFHGADIAIAVAHQTSSGIGHDGKKVASSNVTTRIWRLRDGRWQVILNTTTPVEKGAK